MTLRWNNQSAIYLMANLVFFHERTKHIEVKYNFIPDHVINGTIATSQLL